MTTNDYLNMMLNMLGINEENYDGKFFDLPFLVAKDGFDISIQCSSYHYCGSENGEKKFGKEWKVVEWGYPSTPIDHTIFGDWIECDEETVETVGFVETKYVDDLMQEHGGIDIIATLSNAHKSISNYFKEQLFSQECRTQVSTE